jgi:hypothetical protein
MLLTSNCLAPFDTETKCYLWYLIIS